MSRVGKLGNLENLENLKELKTLSAPNTATFEDTEICIPGYCAVVPRARISSAFNMIGPIIDSA